MQICLHYVRSAEAVKFVYLGFYSYLRSRQENLSRVLFFCFPNLFLLTMQECIFLQALEKILHGLRKILQALRSTIQGFENFSGGIFILFWCSARRAECVQIFL